MNRKTKWTPLLILLCIFLLGLSLRLFSAAETRVDTPIRADARDYYLYAYNLRHHHVYSKDAGPLKSPDATPAPDAVRQPGYPLFLTPFVDSLPSNEILGRIVISQALLSTLTLILSFSLYRSFLPVSLALGASLLTAISPHLIAANSYLLTEPLFCLFIILTVCAVGGFARQPAVLRALVVGLLLGVGNLVRPSLQYFPLLMAAVFLIHLGWKKGLQYSLVMMAGFLLFFAPWLIRNQTVLGKLMDDRLMINTLHHGMYPDFQYQENVRTYGYPYHFDPRSNEISQSMGAVIHEIGRHFREEPAKYLKWYLLGKPVAFWSWGIVQGDRDIFVYPVLETPYHGISFFEMTRDLSRQLHWVVVCLAAAASILIWFPLWSGSLQMESLMVPRLIALLLLYFTLLHAVGLPCPRYAVPLRPLVFGMAFLFPFLAGKLISRKHPIDRFADESAV